MKHPPFCLFCTLCARKETYVLLSPPGLYRTYLHQDCWPNQVSNEPWRKLKTCLATMSI